MVDIEGTGELTSIYARGSCTDQSWQSSACINQCIYEGTYDKPGPLVPCSNNVNAFFCYYLERNNDGERCEQREDVFTLVGGNSIRTTIGVAVSTQVSTQISTIRSVETETSVATIFVTPSPSPSPSPSPTPSPSSFSTSLRNTPPQNTPSNTDSDGRATTSSGASAPTNISQPVSSSSSNHVVIGAAVGGSAGFVLLCAIAYLGYLLGKRRQADKMTPSEPMVQMPPNQGQSYGQYPTNMPIPHMNMHQFMPAPVPPTHTYAPTPVSISPAPTGTLPPMYTPYNAQSFGPPLAYEVP
ncbi:hypothetical protein TWF730_009265 [Orbilia blumenaviensis]|uniref:Uncharacterized protein n=1 Tax=Orbilia blumenaviensis TaxID=1796055 RepID=A0AAV9UYI5_9PEZI